MKGESKIVDSLESLTAIVPLDLQFRPRDILSKARLMAEIAEKISLKIVFSHNDRCTTYDRQLKEALQAYSHVTLVSGEFYEGTVNTSHLRNIAFNQVTSSHLILLDVDLWLDQKLLLKHLKKLKNNQKPFIILPCLYLSNSGSRALVSGKKSQESLTNEYFQFSRKEFLHLANPSSIVMMNSADYEEVGGFDDKFTGHGYEDFDFLIRLASLHGAITPSPDFFFNTTMRSPLFAQGFRRELGRLCIEPLLDREFFLHIFHPKNPESKEYYSQRQKNYALFCETHKSYADGCTPQDPTLITAFVNECVDQGRLIQNYSIYFENKPGHIDRFDTIRRRLKFLIQ